MAFQFASKAQVELLRELTIKTEQVLQQYAQGSLRNTRIDAATATAVNTLLGSLNTALDAVIAAVVDVTPSAFSFTDITGAVTSTVYISNAIEVQGITDGNTVAISVTGGLYSVNNGPWTASAGTVVLGDKVRARAVSSGTGATAVNVAVTIGGVSDTYTVTTA